MKLKEYLKNLDGNTIVSIGANRGSGYMYIGKAENVDLILKIFEEYREEKMFEFAELIDKLTKWSFDTPEKTGMEATDARNVVEYATLMHHLCVTYKKTEKYLRTYRNPFDRDIVATTKRIDEKGYRVIIEGREYGDFWFKSEFDEKYNV